MNRYITIGQAEKDKGSNGELKWFSNYAQQRLGQKSIDLSRFISAKLRLGDCESYITVVLRGNGWFSLIKDDKLELPFSKKEDAQSDYIRLMEAANEWSKRS